MLKRFFAPVIVMFAVIATSPCDAASLESTISAAARIEAGQDRSAFRQLEDRARATAADPKSLKELEDGLIQLLDSSTTYEAKAFAAQQLAYLGSERAIPQLAVLLENVQTAPLACIALGGIGTAKADAALRNALGSAKEKTLLQVMNTLADRRDEKSIEAFSRLATSGNRETEHTAITALGRVGTSRSAAILTSLQKRTAAESTGAIQQALLTCAARMAEDRNIKAAGRLYEGVYANAQSAFTRRAALTGMLALDQDKGRERALKVLRGADDELKPIAIQALRGLPVETDLSPFVREMPKLNAEHQAMLIEAFANRREPEATRVIEAAIAGSDPALRSTAIKAVGEAGGPEAVRFLSLASQNTLSAEEARLVEASFATLPGAEQTDSEIFATFEKSSGKQRALLLRVLAARQGERMNKVLLQEASSSDIPLARAALRALSKSAGPAEAPLLLERLSKAQNESIRAEARAASERALAQVPSGEARFSMLSKELSKSTDTEAKAALISLMPICGTSAALERLREYLAKPEPLLRDAALTAAVDWPNMEAWNLLRSEYLQSQDAAERGTTLRGMVRLAEAANAKPDAALVQRYENLFEIARGDADRKLILGGLGGVADARALDLALAQLAYPEVRAEAAAAVRRIAEAINKTAPEAASTALKKISQDKR